MWSRSVKKTFNLTITTVKKIFNPTITVPPLSFPITGVGVMGIIPTIVTGPL